MASREMLRRVSRALPAHQVEAADTGRAGAIGSLLYAQRLPALEIGAAGGNPVIRVIAPHT